MVEPLKSVYSEVRQCAKIKILYGLYLLDNHVVSSGYSTFYGIPEASHWNVMPVSWFGKFSEIPFYRTY